jgi:hypothetical protein
MPVSIQAITGYSVNFGLRFVNAPVNAVEPVERYKNPDESDEPGIALGKPATTDIFTQSQNRTNEGMGEPTELTNEEKMELAELKSRDREVRGYERAHVTAGGNLVTRGASYDYKTSPNGQRYAVPGEVGIDTSEVHGDPEATIRKMAQVVRAALAPTDPSSQDRRIAGRRIRNQHKRARNLPDIGMRKQMATRVNLFLHPSL